MTQTHQSMKITLRLSRRTAVLAVLLIPSAWIQAQTAAPQPAPAEPEAQTPAAAVTTVPAPAPGAKREEEVVKLSPFEVTATSKSERYTATSTLAGNRLNTQLRDIGSSVSVITSQFLLSLIHISEPT